MPLIPITSADHIPGETIIDHLDVVYGNTVRAKHLGRDVMAGLKSVVGGEIRGYTEMLRDARDEALDRMKQDAIDVGETRSSMSGSRPAWSGRAWRR